MTVDAPYRAHPHNLVGKEGCKKGVCTIEMDPDTMTCTFPSLGIQCIKKKEIEPSLLLREQIRVDPYQSENILETLLIFGFDLNVKKPLKELKDILV